jgi:hypothetical protein
LLDRGPDEEVFLFLGQASGSASLYLETDERDVVGLSRNDQLEFGLKSTKLGELTPVSWSIFLEVEPEIGVGQTRHDRVIFSHERFILRLPTSVVVQRAMTGRADRN